MKKKIILISISAFIIIISLLGLYFYRMSTRNAIEQFIAGDIMINILVAGNNVYNDSRHKLFCVISIQPGTKKIGIAFLPPNFRVNLDERKQQYQKIDSVDISDFEPLSESLYRDLKMKIPFYVVLYSPDIERLIDLIGGVEMYVLDQAGDISGLKYGLNYLDGARTVKYINSAEQNSIYIKYDRIVDVLLTIFSNRNEYKKFFTAEFISEAVKSIKTNMLAQEIATLSGILYSGSTDMLCTIMPGFFSDNDFYQVDNISYKIHESEFLKRLIQDEQAEQSVKVKILNGTNISGLAMRTRAILIREGLNVIEFGTSPYEAQEKTVVISQKGETGPAFKVAELLSIKRIYHVVDSTQLNNVLVITGRDLANEKEKNAGR